VKKGSGQPSAISRPSQREKPVKKLLTAFVKIGIPIAIITWLVMDARGDQAFSDLHRSPKNWFLLAAACASCSMAVLITLVRWYYLVRALELPVRFRDALRIGFVGYLFNLAPMGIVGGDLLKAWILAREQRGQEGCRTKSIASVVLDRVIGLYTLFVVASIAIVLTGFWNHENANLRYIAQATLWLTGLGTAAVSFLFVPSITDGRLAQALCSLRRGGTAFEQLFVAMRMYRSKPLVLTAATIMTLGVHSFFTIGVFLIAKGVFQSTLPQVLTLGIHFVICPLSAATGVIPLCMGPLETVLSFLYAVVSGVKAAQAQGLVVALGYRIITVLIATVGFCYYLASRQEVAEVIHEVEQEHPEPVIPTPEPVHSAKPPKAVPIAVNSE
jgi:hypothetical protein